MVRALGELERGNLASAPQSADGITYARKIDKAESHIDFARPPAPCTIASAACRHSRVPGSPSNRRQGGAHQGARARRWSKSGRPPGEIVDDRLTVACADGAVRLVELQRAGKRPMTSAELLRGFPLPRGRTLQV